MNVGEAGPQSQAYRVQSVIRDASLQTASSDILAPANSPAPRLLDRLGLRIGLAATSFLTVWLVVNHHIFRQPILGAGDDATILLQVDSAKHFRELLGNYSRWRFHHPGPGFLYILALGDSVFRDLLRITPGPLNSAVLTLLLLYTCFLFATIWIFQQRSESSWFLPAAVAASLWFIYVVDCTFAGLASGYVWLPDMLLFCFLLFVAACASLVIGEARHLPLVTFCGMLLIHGHVAQLLFVGLLASFAIATWLLPKIRQAGWPATLSIYRRPLLISLGIVVVFAFPVLLEAVLHRPNNLQNLFAYLQEHRGPQNSWLTCIKYVSSFVAFIPDPEVVLLNPAAHLLSRAGSRPYVLAYWGAFIFLLGLTVGKGFARPSRIPRFLKYVIFEIIFITILVAFWARKIAGGLYSFNAHFFFATFLLGTFVLLSLLMTGRFSPRKKPWDLILACVLPLVMLAAPDKFSEHNEQERANISGIVSNLPSGIEKLRITWPQSGDWPITVGVASWLQYRHRTFCIPDYWGFMFGEQHVCHDLDGLDNLIVVHQPTTCVAPCRIIFQNGPIAAEIIPVAREILPFTLHTDDPDMLTTGFYEPEGEHGPIWSARRSAVHFVLALEWHPTDVVRLRVSGAALPKRPLKLSVNDHYIGAIDGAGLGSWEFKVPASAFRGGSENELVFSVDHAGPVGADTRTLGFQLREIQFLPGT